MQVSLDQSEIELAVRNYVRSIINIPEDREIGVEFTAGRGANGITASLDIRATLKSDSGKASAERPVGDLPKAQAKAEPVTQTEEGPEPEAESETVEAEPEAEPEKLKTAPKASPFSKSSAAAANTVDSDAEEGEDTPAPAKAPGGSIFSKAS